MLFRQIFDPKLAQYAYLIGCQQTGEALIIDPERDVDRYLAIAAAEGLEIVAATETHIHADFLSGARELAATHGVRLYLSAEGGEDWQYEWARGEDYDVQLLHDGDTFRIGRIEIRALHTPGHTPEHLSFLVTDLGGGAHEPMGLASGDFVFVGDLGRPDLLETAAGVAGAREPSARTLFRSVERFLELPDHLQLWPAHGAGSACGKALGSVPISTVGYEKRHNASIDAARRGEDAFVDDILAGQPEPPLYFATMKRLNRGGPPVLGGLPRPPRLDAAALVKALGRDDTVVVDTRLDRRAFMDTHVEGSLFAPLNKTFPTITGSYLEPDQSVVLLVTEEHLDEAVRDLIRIGFDRLLGYVTPEVLVHAALAGHLRQTPVIDFAQATPLAAAGALPLDVRGAVEHAAGAFHGSLNIPHTRLLERLDEIPASAELLVYCASGARASSATALLERLGRRVRYVDDDFAHWHGARLSA
ncbi:MAG: MBL fold metallo-hydrolase [Acidobacteria bacterium]|nr:MBL fold metallo-hydrolase [Acidobacteriota bacterium]